MSGQPRWPKACVSDIKNGSKPDPSLSWLVLFMTAAKVLVAMRPVDFRRGADGNQDFGVVGVATEPICW